MQLPTLEEALEAADSRRPLTAEEKRMPAAVREDDYARTRHAGLTMHCPRCQTTASDFHINDSYCRPCRNAYERERQARLRVLRCEKINAEGAVDV